MISKLIFVIICGIKYLNLFLHEIQFGLNEDYFDFYQIHEFIVLEGIFRNYNNIPLSKPVVSLSALSISVFLV